MLRQIQEGATEDTVPLSTVLRRCKVLAARLKHAELDGWVEHELNGYPNWREMPDYRTMSTQVLGNFNGYFQSRILGAQIPTRSIPAEHQDWAFHHHFDEGIAHYEELLRSNKSKGEDAGDMQAPLPIEFVARHLAGEGKVLEKYACVEAYRPVTRAMLKGMLDTVRNRVLTFSLDIETEFPELVNEPLPARQQMTDRLSQIFNITIWGGSNTIAAGSGTASQLLGAVVPGDLRAFRTVLASLGVDREAATDLERAISEDQAEGADGIGCRAKEWIARTSAVVAKGGLVVGSEAAGGMLAQIVMRYLGLA